MYVYTVVLGWRVGRSVCRRVGAVAGAAAVATGTVVTTSTVIIMLTSQLRIGAQRGHVTRRTTVLHTPSYWSAAVQTSARHTRPAIVKY